MHESDDYAEVTLLVGDCPIGVEAPWWWCDVDYASYEATWTASGQPVWKEDFGWFEEPAAGAAAVRGRSSSPVPRAIRVARAHAHARR